mgnify:CR=1 FL=1
MKRSGYVKQILKTISKSGKTKEYLGATGYGTSDEIAEEIEIWKDLGKLEKQAAKFKPKLDLPKASKNQIAMHG